LFLIATPALANAPSWVQAFGSSGNGNNIANAIKAAPDHNLYVAGQFSSTATFDKTTLTASGPSEIFLAKYSPSGSLLWIAYTAGGVVDKNNAAQGIDLDADGNVYVTGSFGGNTTFYSANPANKKITVASGDGAGIFLAKYTPSGTLLWVQTGISTCAYPCSSYGVAVNSAAGTVYLAIATQGDNTFSSADGTSHVISAIMFADMERMELAKYDTNGNFQWAENNLSFGDGSGATGVAVDSKDNAYILGWFSGRTDFYSAAVPPITVNPFAWAVDQYLDYTGTDTFLAKYDKNGNAQWVNHFCGYTSSPGAVAVGPSGEVTMVGYTEDSLYWLDVYEVYKQTYTRVSSQPPGATINLGSGIIADPGNTDEVVATYNPAGVLIRAWRHGGTDNESATGVGYDSRGNLYVTGLAGNAQPKLFVDAYSGQNLLWEATASAGKWTFPPALTVDAAGSAFVAGGYQGTASFGNSTLSGTGASEAFVAELNTAYANQSADLVLHPYASATTVHQGDLLTFTFPVWDRGPDVAYHEVLNTQVPEGTVIEYIRISGTPGLGTCTRPPYHQTGQIVCHENSSMAPNTTWTVRLTLKVTASPGTVITANAATMADTPDPNMANNTATVSLKVQ
jgi:hypothetical protein